MLFYFESVRLLRIIRKFMTIIGLIPISVRFRTLHISIVFIIVASVPFWGIWHTQQSFQSESELSKIVNISSLLVMWMVHIVIILETWNKEDKYYKTILHYERLHENLFSKYPYNKGHLSSSKLYWRAFRGYIFMFLEFIEILVLSYLLHLDGLSWMQWCFNIYSDLTLKSKLIEFMFFVFLVNNFQHDLNSTLTQVITDYHSLKTGNIQLISRQHARENLNTLGEKRNEIWMGVKMVEDLCEYSLVGVLLKMYCDLTYIAYWSYRSLQTETTTFYKLICFSLFLVRGVALSTCCWTCTSCEILERTFINNLHEKAAQTVDKNLNTIIKELSLDLLHKKIQFSAGDIIAINVKTLGGILFSGVTFVVILIQFQMDGTSNI